MAMIIVPETPAINGGGITTGQTTESTAGGETEIAGGGTVTAVVTASKAPILWNMM